MWPADFAGALKVLTRKVLKRHQELNKPDFGAREDEDDEEEESEEESEESEDERRSSRASLSLLVFACMHLCLLPLTGRERFRDALVDVLGDEKKVKWVQVNLLCNCL